MLKLLLMLIILSPPMTSNAETIHKEDLHKSITNYPHPILCDLIEGGRFVESVILTWGQLDRIERGKALVFIKDGKEIRIGPKSSYVCRKMLGT